MGSSSIGVIASLEEDVLDEDTEDSIPEPEDDEPETGPEERAFALLEIKF